MTSSGLLKYFVHAYAYAFITVSVKATAEKFEEIVLDYLLCFLKKEKLSKNKRG
jgi:hypothetical protein